MHEGTLQPLLTGWALPSQEVHAVFRPPRPVPAKVTRFVDFLQPHFEGEWWAGNQAGSGIGGA